MKATFQSRRNASDTKKKNSIGALGWRADAETSPTCLKLNESQEGRWRRLHLQSQEDYDRFLGQLHRREDVKAGPT